MELVRRLDIVDQLGRVESPTLVSVGMLDRVTPVAAAEEVVDALPEGIGQLEVIEGAGHWARKDAPDRFWPIIIEFIDSATIREPPDAQAVSASARQRGGMPSDRGVVTPRRVAGTRTAGADLGA